MQCNGVSTALAMQLIDHIITEVGMIKFATIGTGTQLFNKTVLTEILTMLW